jgi:hypothetical protein
MSDSEIATEVKRHLKQEHGCSLTLTRSVTDVRERCDVTGYFHPEPRNIEGQFQLTGCQRVPFWKGEHPPRAPEVEG